MSRCTGHCCTRFTLPSYPIIRQIAARGDDEAKHILDLIIPLGGEIFNGDLCAALGAHGQRVYVYTCRELQPNGDCGIYDERPKLCRDYPYGKRCEHDGCTMTPELQQEIQQQ